MRRFGSALIYALVVAAFVYINGVAFNGLLNPQTRALTTGLLTLTVTLWLVLRWRLRWKWRRTPLDLAVGLWLAAFALSLLANHEAWRRILLGLWFALFYVGVWVLLCDLLANDGIKRENIVDALLVAGALLIVMGYIQSRDWAFNQLPLMLNGTISLDLPRPGSLLGNPNFLGGFLAVTLPLAFGRLLRGRGIGRVVMGLYFMAGLLMLLLTFSRGGWVAFGAAAVVSVALLFGGALRPAALRAWWARSALLLRAGGAALALGLAAAVIVFGVFFARSFTQTGRSVELRTYIYDAAITAFVERSITGYGQFTFGQALARGSSQPPLTPHNHAHNIVLHVAAELGTVGLIAFGALLITGGWAMWRNWRGAASRDEAISYAAAIAGMTAFTVHHLFDVSAMNPAIALTGLFALAAAVYPVQKPAADRHAAAQGAAAVALWLALIGTGLWTARLYGEYVGALAYAIGEQDYRGGAARLEPVIAADPQLAIYHYQQGILLALAAADGDDSALPEAIAAFERYTTLEPYYAIGWANLGALRWQADDQPGAIDAMGRAFALAPRGWSFGQTLGTYLESAGDSAGARAAYDQTLRETSTALFAPDWGATELQRAAAAAAEQSPFAETVRLLDAGDAAAAAAAWVAAPERRANSSLRYAVDALLALARGDDAAARAALSAAEAFSVTGEDRAWLFMAQARYEAVSGEAIFGGGRLEAARDALRRGTFDADYAMGANIHYIQFLRTAIPRLFAPQVNYPLADPALLHWLARGTEQGVEQGEGE